MVIKQHQAREAEEEEAREWRKAEEEREDKFAFICQHFRVLSEVSPHWVVVLLKSWARV